MYFCKPKLLILFASSVWKELWKPNNHCFDYLLNNRNAIVCFLPGPSYPLIKLSLTAQRKQPYKSTSVSQPVSSSWMVKESPQCGHSDWTVGLGLNLSGVWMFTTCRHSEWSTADRPAAALLLQEFRTCTSKHLKYSPIMYSYFRLYAFTICHKVVFVYSSL